MKPTVATTLRAISARPSGTVSPCRLTMPLSSASTAAAMRPRPTTSSLPPLRLTGAPPGAATGRYRCASSIATTQNGVTTKKIERQP